MALSTEQHAAYQVFGELGWAQARLADVESLPLGTPQQQATARRGLTKGPWGITADDRNPWDRALSFDEVTRLRCFAMRLGASASRAPDLLWCVGDVELVIRLIAARGAGYADAYVRNSRGYRTGLDWTLSSNGAVVLPLVTRLSLPLPDDRDYLDDWAVAADHILNGANDHNGASDRYRKNFRWPAPGDIRPRFAEHFAAAVAAGLSPTRHLGRLAVPAVGNGWLDRDQAVELAFAALDAAHRPIDRKTWLEVLDGLQVRDDELVERTELLVPVLAHGEGAVIERLAPLLIARVDDALLGDVLAVTLPTTVRKSARQVLSAAASRTRPADETVAVASALVEPHLLSTDRALARAAGRLVEAWGLLPTSRSEPEAASFRWRETPQVWEVPRFDPGEATPQRLTDLAAVLYSRPGEVEDIEVDRFLAVANQVARHGIAEARAALAGVKENRKPGLRHIPGWVSGATAGLDPRAHLILERLDERFGSTWFSPADAREGTVVLRLGQLPVLLSTPTWVDLRIDPAALAERLETYAAEGVDATPADLFLALSRLDVRLADDDLRNRLEPLSVKLVGLAGEAGSLVLQYLNDPITSYWKVPLHYARLTAWHVHLSASPFAFPMAGDAIGGWAQDYPLPGIGLELRQRARRGEPLPPGAAINLIGIQRRLSPVDVEDGALAVREAWERGLLRPGVPDVALLDWTGEPPTSLAALAAVCRDLAADSMVSVVWPILDDLIVASLAQRRLLPGTADVAEAVVALLPAVRAAALSGLAPDTAFDLPGLRGLAARGGGSRAVQLARAAVADLPEPSRGRP